MRVPAQANPELGLKLFIPPVAQTVLDISADVQTEEKLDQELLFNMLLLKEVRLAPSWGTYG